MINFEYMSSFLKPQRTKDGVKIISNLTWHIVGKNGMIGHRIMVKWMDLGCQGISKWKQSNNREKRNGKRTPLAREGEMIGLRALGVAFPTKNAANAYYPAHLGECPKSEWPKSRGIRKEESDQRNRKESVRETKPKESQRTIWLVWRSGGCKIHRSNRGGFKPWPI